MGIRAYIPRSKDTVHREFNQSIGEAVVPLAEDMQIIHYDEQFPKKGRSQKFRLTLLDANGTVVGEELHNKRRRSRSFWRDT